MKNITSSSNARIWMNKLIHSFLVRCRNPCLQGASVRVVSPQPNARRVPFEYPQYYLNMKGKAFKARVNEQILIKYNSFKKISKRFLMQVLGDFFKKCNYSFDLTNFPVALCLFRFLQIMIQPKLEPLPPPDISFVLETENIISKL